MHGIDVRWFTCDFEGCGKKAKANSLITQHKATVHNIGVKWKYCPQCDFKAKMGGNITGHIARVHKSK